MEMQLFKNITPQNMPERMNNPFSYEPHPLCIEACRELQDELSQRNDWREEIDRGKMFGVLIVEADNSKIGYLRAYSGQIGGRSDWEGFVPAVFDYLQPDGYFKVHEAEISEMNQQIRQFEANENLIKAKNLIDDLQQKRQEVIANYQTKIKEAKEKRDARRQEALSAGTPLSEEEEKAMIKESQFMKAELKRLKKSINEKTAYETLYENYEKDLKSAKQLRKQLSEELQQWLFSKFQMRNAEGETKDLLEIFKDEAVKIPPAGSGECCEPKLLQYAYQHGYKPTRPMPHFRWHMKQRGAVLAKGRLLGLQFQALLEDGLYFDLARRANELAFRLRDGVAALGYPFPVASPSNQQFPVLPNETVAKLQEMGYEFETDHPVDANHTCIRLVTSWATPETAVEDFLRDLAGC